MASRDEALGLAELSTDYSKWQDLHKRTTKRAWRSARNGIWFTLAETLQGRMGILGNEAVEESSGHTIARPEGCITVISCEGL